MFLFETNFLIILQVTLLGAFQACLANVALRCIFSSEAVRKEKYFPGYQKATAIFLIVLAPVVQKLDSAISYPPDKSLSSG